MCAIVYVVFLFSGLSGSILPTCLGATLLQQTSVDCHDSHFFCVDLRFFGGMEGLGITLCEEALSKGVHSGVHVFMGSSNPGPFIQYPSSSPSFGQHMHPLQQSQSPKQSSKVEDLRTSLFELPILGSIFFELLEENRHMSHGAHGRRAGPKPGAAPRRLPSLEGLSPSSKTHGMATTS